MSAPDITYRRYQPGEEESVLDLYNLVFPGARSLARWHWEYRQSPLGPGTVVLAFSGPQLVGHAGGIPLSFRIEGQHAPASRSQNGFVHPDFRRRAVYGGALGRYLDDLAAEGVGFTLGFPNDRSLRGLLQAGYAPVCDVYPYRLPIDRLAGGEPDGLRLVTGDGSAFGPADEATFRRELGGFGVVNERGAAYLGWRYHPTSGRRYRVVRAFVGDRLVGLLVGKAYPEGGSIDLVEIAIPPDEALLRAALREMGRAFAGEGLQSFAVWSMSHYPLHPLLLRLGFEREDRPTHLVARPLRPLDSGRLRDPEAYYLSMGDSDVY